MTMAPRERLSDWVARHPASLPGRLVALRHGLPRPSDRREVATPPDTEVRVLIGPANHAGQATRWARALEDAVEGLGARSFAVETRFGFPADAVVVDRVFQNSARWQRSQMRAARGFTHLLVESVRPPFGRLARRDLRKQLALLPADVRVAFVCHGTDVRSNRRPSDTLTPTERQTDRIAARHRALLAELDRPTFVTTPDLLDDMPDAVWLPVVVDVGRWEVGERPAAARLRVVHAPSRSAVKGTALIEPIARALHEEGVIDYRPLSGVPHADMPGVLRDADVVLDQFVLGSYGVAACEAMAAGAVVVGHVTPSVRERVHAATGRTLPLVESTPETLDAVLRGLADDVEERERLAAAGRMFVHEVHDGRVSAEILSRNWIDATPRRKNE
ncbi:glycosyltransferase [Microbacterium sp. W4I20]|uniref:glycosyltransferase family protein n=1 Tax=Microbacterium sp. W4I20 TaxID=3042262 RepID=UPI0027894FA5|nr:glycosyltransferase [Microbacterium sp. W4I20]MDQ0725927.1 hypothetical protein [Microbacterium sp. W4I20]